MSLQKIKCSLILLCTTQHLLFIVLSFLIGLSQDSLGQSVVSQGGVLAKVNNGVSWVSPATSPILTLTGTGSVILDDSHHTVVIEPTYTGGLSIPVASSQPGKTYRIVNRRSSSITMTRSYNGIGGGTSNTINANSSTFLQSDGINWYQIK